METNREEQRWNFVMAFQTGQWSMTKLCERYGITPSTTTGRTKGSVATVVAPR